ncbi:MAG: gliding motility lipoprotein GldH [Cryomorphaceae bacterium]|nr:gliding motility lipoprotein GldH [Cryomorphaceae bacterium]
MTTRNFSDIVKNICLIYHANPANAKSLVLKRINEAVKLIVFGFIFALGSCSDGALVNSYFSIDREGWPKDSVIEVEVLIMDTNAAYIGMTGIRHNPNYPYRNFYLFREVVSERGLEYRDTIMFMTSDAKGKRLGKGLGHTREIIAPLGSAPIRFGTKGIYTFRFIQGMRPDVLPGIEEVFFRLEPIETES